LDSKSSANSELIIGVIRAFDSILEGKSASEFFYNPDRKESAEFNFLLYGMLRWHYQLLYLINLLAKKNINSWQKNLILLLELGLFQILFSNKPEYAVVNNANNATFGLGISKAKPIINGCLRSFLRDQDKFLFQLHSNDEANYAHPEWMVKYLKNQFPNNWQNILTENNVQAPMMARINSRLITNQEYKKNLSSKNISYIESIEIPYGVIIDPPMPYSDLPGYETGLISVQDFSSQIVVQELNPKNGETILDICSAPGGKLGYIYELAPQSKITSIEKDELRYEYMLKNMERLGVDGQFLNMDAQKIENFFPSKSFNKVLIDAPCSSLGVIRRHPEIKHHRRQHDFNSYQATQLSLIKSAWPLLKKDGELVYSVCTYSDEETKEVITKILKEFDNINLISQRLILPGDNGMNGLYYAKLKKS